MAVVVVLALVIGAAWLFQRRLIYFPDSDPLPSASSVLPGAEDVLLETEDGLELGAWLGGRIPTHSSAVNCCM